MKFNISDMGGFDQALAYSKKYDLGFEIQHFETGEMLDKRDLPDEINMIKKKLKGFSDISMHGPFYDLIPASRDKKIRIVTLERFNQIYDVAKELKAKHIVLHSGYAPKTCPKDKWIKNSISFWNEFLHGKDDGIKIHVENVYENDFDLLRELVESVDNELFSICLDIGHVNSYSSIFIKDWLTGLNSCVGYTHIHNNYGDSDDHLGFYNGSINMKFVLSLLEEHCPHAVNTLETFEVDSTIDWLKDNNFL